MITGPRQQEPGTATYSWASHRRRLDGNTVVTESLPM
jgi:hypothetical protein